MTNLHPLHLADSQKSDLVSVLEKEGVQFKRRGNRLWALSPFRTEKIPSFMADTISQRWFDFGSGKGGDIIDFIKELKNLSFKEALSYLGINGKPHKSDQKEQRKRELLQRFRTWCQDYHNDLCQLIRTFYKAKQNTKTVEEVEALVEFYHKESVWLAQIEILQGNDDQAKFELYKEVVYGN